MVIEYIHNIVNNIYLLINLVYKYRISYSYVCCMRYIITVIIQMESNLTNPI